MTPRISAVAIVALWLTIGAAGAQPADFSFQFEFGCESPDILDTLTDSFTRLWHDDVPSARIQPRPAYVQPSTTIPLRLSNEQTALIADAIEQARFWSYPADFTRSGRTVPAEVTRITTVVPFQSYRLEVRREGRGDSVVNLQSKIYNLQLQRRVEVASQSSVRSKEPPGTPGALLVQQGCCLPAGLEAGSATRAVAGRCQGCHRWRQA